MSTIQNLKNFIRHGKQARDAQAAGTSPQKGSPAPTALAPTNVTADRGTHHQSRHHGHHGHHGGHHGGHHAQQHQQHAISAPMPAGNDVYPKQVPQQQHAFTDALGNNQNNAARAGNAAAAAADAKAKANVAQTNLNVDQDVLQRIIAEERETKGKLPSYPGLERYQLIEKMGDGAFSNVYRAKDTKGVYNEVAVKVVRKFEMNATQGAEIMHPDFKKVPKGVERANILKEVQIMRQLDHPNVVKLVEFAEAKQYYYIVLELCPGGELFHQIVRLTYFSENLSRHVIVQVAKALQYLHETAGVVHRDIKPENLLFYPSKFMPTRNPKPKSADEEDKADEGEFVKGIGAGGIGVIKIADFGLSKVIWDTQTMTPCGTVGYTAPEIVKDERYSKSVDMWALGCVLYTLLCGFPPFYDESIQVLTEKVARGQYTFLSPWWDDISKSAQDLVSHLLTVDPEKRYDINQFLNHPWIRESREETYAAADAPPLATPLIRQAQAAGQDPQLLQAYLDETPGGSGRRMDFRSPGAVNLREVFDVGYAVHRQEEEGKRRKNFVQGYRGGTAGINSLNEDYDDGIDDEYASTSAPFDATRQQIPAKIPKAGGAGAVVADVQGVERQMRNTTLSAAAQARQAHAPAAQARTVVPSAAAGAVGQSQAKGYGQHSAEVAAAARRQVRNKGPFELSLEGSTLLGRRGKKGGGGPGAASGNTGAGPSGLREQVVQ